MRWTRIIPALVALVGLAPLALAQSGSGRISGTVTEAAGGQPVANVTVSVVGTRLGALTGPDGRYNIGAVPAGTHHVRASRLGFTPAQDTVVVRDGETATLSLRLPQVSVTLDQVVVVGYGTQRRSDLTGSVTSITPSVETTPTTSLEQTLQGTAPGVQVTTASSAPGGGISIRV